jgi:hypothetical protein
MPNWCENSVRVNGDPKEVKEFIEFVKSDDSDFDFEKICPFPNGEWDYDWCINSWGTKWSAQEISTDHDQEVADYYFDTAWSPPEGIYSELVKKFKIGTEESSLHISWFYNEPNMEICGYLQNEVE